MQREGCSGKGRYYQVEIWGDFADALAGPHFLLDSQEPSAGWSAVAVVCRQLTSQTILPTTDGR